MLRQPQLEDTAVYDLRGSTSSQKRPVGYEKEVVKASLEFQMSRFEMVQDEQSAGTVLERVG